MVLYLLLKGWLGIESECFLRPFKERRVNGWESLLRKKENFGKERENVRVNSFR